jgi:hypothetical protein
MLVLSMILLDNVSKDKECLCTKMEHVKVVHESMTPVMEEEEKKLNVLQQSSVMDGGDFNLQLVTLDFYRKMVSKQDKTIANVMAQQKEH